MNSRKFLFLSITLIFLLLSISISSYYIFILPKINLEKEKINNEIEKEKLIGENEKELLKRKLECSELINDIEKEMIEEENREKNNSYKRLFAHYFEFGFYSPKEVSCLYVTRSDDWEYFIYNALTGSTITSFQKEQVDEYKNFLYEYSNGEIRK